MEYENSVLLKESEYLKSSIKENQRHLSNVSAKIAGVKGQILHPLAGKNKSNVRQKAVNQYNKFRMAIDSSESREDIGLGKRRLNIDVDML